MKTRNLLATLLMLISVTLFGKEKVIETPVFLARNSNILEIEKIVKSDTATVLHIKAFYRPNYWIMIKSTTQLMADNGKIYPIKGIDKFSLDSEFYMPESGETTFQMIFPALPAAVNRVDLIEGAGQGDWAIWGIELNGKQLPKLELPAGASAAMPDKNMALPAPEFGLGTATLKGQILEYREGMDKVLRAYLSGCFMRMGENLPIDIAEDGRFSAEVPVVTVTPGEIYCFNQYIPFFLAPGQETILYLNTRELCRKASKVRSGEKAEHPLAYYAGFMGGISNELIGLGDIYQHEVDYETLLSSAEGKSLEELRDQYIKDKAADLATIDALKVSPATKEVLKANVAVQTIQKVLGVKSIFKRSYIIVNKLNNDEANEYFSAPLEVSDDFFDAALENFTEKNSPALIYGMEYGRIVGYPFFFDLINGDSTDGLFSDIGYVSSVLNQIADYQPATDEQFARLNALGEPAFVQIVEAKNAALLQSIEANKKKAGYRKNELGEVVNEDLFASIISAFQGKVILVDFWATWCGPCVQANKAMKPMKEELAQEDVVYLYIAGENSPKGTWENMIADIGGEHFRLTQEQWEYITRSFGINGVPTYMVVDREGNISYKSTGFPGAEKMKEEIRKGL